MIALKEKYKKALPELKKKLRVSNNLAVPKIEKVVVGAGTGSFKDKNKFNVVVERLAKITGQKASPRSAKQSIAGFKVRQGDIVGASVTLRGGRMFDFLDRLINIAIPRERDFRGIKESSVDEMGNLTLGFREHTIFPETGDEDIKDIFGLSVTVVTTAKNREEALILLKELGFPLKKGK